MRKKPNILSYEEYVSDWREEKTAKELKNILVREIMFGRGESVFTLRAPNHSSFYYMKIGTAKELNKVLEKEWISKGLGDVILRLTLIHREYTIFEDALKKVYQRDFGEFISFLLIILSGFVIGLVVGLIIGG